ncbi:WD and tetratricopeptide repeats protein 1 [Halotydeus destructor]|nr:WD and tetratricopeptide repeats protein 1 [Halotydeus destructor]
MMQSRNIVHHQIKREIDSRSCFYLEKHNQVNDALIERLGLVDELEGHGGCVNCLHWSSKGELLASGSDDTQIKIWKPLQARNVASFPSGHQSNIFSVKFVPGSGDCTLVTCAADGQVRVHSVLDRETTMVCTCHHKRVKRLAITPSEPSMFWSCGEDGLVLEYDLRKEHRCKNSFRSAWIDLDKFTPNAEVKSIDINPVRPEMIAVGADDPYVRIFDRRMLKKSASKKGSAVSTLISALECQVEDSVETAKYCVPAHMSVERVNLRNNQRSVHCSGVQFSPNGRELLVTYNSEQLYLFNVLSSESCGTFDAKKALSSATSSVSVAKTIYKSFEELPPKIAAVKEKANKYFEDKYIASSMELYNKAIVQCPGAAVLYGNRAAVLMKRAWYGDVYCAARDCVMAINIDPDYRQVYTRLALCLLELAWHSDAKEVLNAYKTKFAAQGDNETVLAIEKDIEKSECSNLSKRDELRRKRLQKVKLSESEVMFRSKAIDFSKKFCGHSNVATEKGGNFFGKDGQYIMCGSG